MNQSQRWCLLCESYTLHARVTSSCGLGCLLLLLSSILLVMISCGGGIIVLPFFAALFVIAWLAVAILRGVLTPWRCQVCGETGNPGYEPAPTREYESIPIGRAALPSMRLPDGAVPNLDWAMIISGIRRLPSAIDGSIRAAWSEVEATYDGLPDWAEPIVWGFGLSMPVAIVAIGIWMVMHL